MGSFTVTRRAMTEGEATAWREQRPLAGALLGGALIGFGSGLIGGMLGFMLGVLLALLLGLSPGDSARLVLACVALGAVFAAILAVQGQWQLAKSVLGVHRRRAEVLAVEATITAGAVVGFEDGEPTLILDGGQGELLLLAGGIGLFELVARREFPHESFELTLAAGDGALVGYRGRGQPVPLHHQPPDRLEGCSRSSDQACETILFAGQFATWPDDLRAALDRRAAAR